MRKLCLIIVCASSIFTYANSKFQVEVDLGYAFQNQMMLNDENLEKTGAWGIRFGANYLKIINTGFYIETGLYGKYNRGNKVMSNLEFTSRSLRVQLPLYAGYEINEAWKFSIGASVENNKDFDIIDMKTEDNLRYDLLTKLIYKHSEKIHFSFHTNWMLSSIPETYTISNPKNGIYIGAIYQLGKPRKTN